MGKIRDIEISTEVGLHAGHNYVSLHMQASKHWCKCACTLFSYCLGPYNWKIGSNQGDTEINWNRDICIITLMCLHVLPISQQNTDRSEKSRYLWNQGDMKVMSQHMIWPNHTSTHVSTMYSCIHWPLSWPIWSDQINQCIYLWNQKNMLVMSQHTV